MNIRTAVPGSDIRPLRPIETIPLGRPCSPSRSLRRMLSVTPSPIICAAALPPPDLAVDRAGYFFLEVLMTDVRIFKHMLRHIKTLEMDEEEAKADFARHNAEVLAHVNPDKVITYVRRKIAVKAKRADWRVFFA